MPKITKGKSFVEKTLANEFLEELKNSLNEINPHFKNINFDIFEQIFSKNIVVLCSGNPNDTVNNAKILNLIYKDKKIEFLSIGFHSFIEKTYLEAKEIKVKEKSKTDGEKPKKMQLGENKLFVLIENSQKLKNEDKNIIYFKYPHIYSYFLFQELLALTYSKRDFNRECEVDFKTEIYNLFEELKDKELKAIRLCRNIKTIFEQITKEHISEDLLFVITTICNILNQRELEQFHNEIDDIVIKKIIELNSKC